MKIKNCLDCGISLEVRNLHQDYCPNCAEVRRRQSQTRYYLKNIRRESERKRVFYQQNKHKFKQRAEANKEKIKAYRKEWYKANKILVLQRSKIWAENNREKRKEIGRNWVRRNIRQAYDYYKKYLEVHKHTLQYKISVFNRRQRREARLNNVIHSYSFDQWKEKLISSNGICPNCNIQVGIENLSLDHIYPLAKANEDYLKTGIKRVYTINDIQPLCISCNSKKRDNVLKIELPQIENQPTS